MKRSLLYIFLIAFATVAKAQDAGLAPDQNPRYKESQQRYMNTADSLTTTLSTTVQQTYKAYDWYEARMERRQQRREWRHQENLYNGYYNNYYGQSYYNPYTWRNNLWWAPSVNFRWGHSRWYW